VTSELLVLGVSHNTAPVALRERLALTERAGKRFLQELVASEDISEAVAISTCNRTEIYLVATDPVRAEAELLGRLARDADIRPIELASVVYSPRNCDAARQLYRVTAGLDSMIVGEAEVQGQVKRAYELALVEGVTGPISNRLFRDALGAGKRVRTETAIGESPASVSSAAAALAAQVFGDLTGRRVLLVGAGRIGELAASNLVSRGAEIAFVANRTVETARELAHRFGGAAIGLDELGAKLGEVDVVLSSTSSPDAVVRAADVPVRRRAPLFFIDIAVPRDLEPAIAELAGCFLYDIDDLEAVVAETLSGRRAEAERAEQLVAEEAERFRAWRASLDVVPAIASLRARAEEIRSAELAKVRVSDDERRTLESVTAQILNKLLHLPTVRMKEAAVSSDGAVYADAVKHLFGLDDERP
jgi:glutamyl-tRNA reductase